VGYLPRQGDRHHPRELRLRADRRPVQDRQLRRSDAPPGSDRGVAHRRAVDPARRRGPVAGNAARCGALCIRGVRGGGRLPALRFALTVLTLALLAGPAQAQFSLFRRPPAVVGAAPAGTPPAEAAIWPYPAPDPKSWWDDDWP